MKALVAIFLLLSAVQLTIGLVCHKCLYSTFDSPPRGEKGCHEEPDKSATTGCTDSGGLTAYCTTFGEQDGKITIIRDCAHSSSGNCINTTEYSQMCFCKDKDLCNNKNFYNSAASDSVFFLLPILGLVATLF